ncbi:MAG TPA: histidine phosphatase family protein [Roseiflexaceae bacterium]|nr:histidine phosphatase family protein [Roseiflexaceae bacterium]
MSRLLLLIRHAAPAVAEGAAPHRWPLSEDGRRAAVAFAPRVGLYRPTALVASEEPKARETAELIGEQLGIPATTAPGLHEHRRGPSPWLGRDAWEAQIARLFAEPETLVFGEETAAQAQGRFVGAVERVLEAHREGNVGVVAHGTVITLLLAARFGIEPLPFWRALAMPDVVVLTVGNT